MDLVTDLKKQNMGTSVNRCLILAVTMLASVLMLSPVVLAQAQMTYDLTDASGSIDWRDGQTNVTSVTEVYSYDEATDTLTVTATFNASDSLAPLPPMLALAYEYGFPIDFDQTVVSTASYSELGPVLGVQNTNNYTWHITGLGDYVLQARTLGSGQVPAALVQKLENEIDTMVAAGHLSPWLVLSEVPGGQGDQRGEMYWHYPGETLYFLSEAAPLLSGTRLDDLKTYLQNERQTYPPETEVSVPFAAGTRREYCGPTDTLMNKWENDVINFRTTGVPRIWNLYGLSRYYELMDMNPTAVVMNDCNSIINQQMANRHWPSLYWRDGYAPHYNAVHGVNQIFAGLIGYIRMARMTGDADAEDLGWGLLGRMAALRFAMGKYTQYEYDYGYFTIGDPENPEWYVEQEAGTWVGDLVTWNWTEPIDNVRQVHWLTDCNVMTWEWCSVGYFRDDNGQKTLPPWPNQPANRQNWAQGTAYQLPFCDMVPELGRFLYDHLGPEVQEFCDRVVENQPHWYTSYAEAILGQEIGFNVPGDSYGNFIARAWVLEEDPNSLKHYIDTPWVARGDLFYIHKLAETIKAFKGVTWTGGGTGSIQIGTGLSTNTDLQQAATEAAQEVKAQMGATTPQILIISEDLDVGSQSGMDTVLDAIAAEFPGIPVYGRGDKWYEYDPYDETGMTESNGLSLLGISGVTVTTAYVTDVHSSYDEATLRAKGQQLANNLGTLPQGNHLMLLFGDFHGQGMQKFIPGVTDVLGTDFPLVSGSSNDWSPYIYQDGQKTDYGAQAIVLTGDFGVNFSIATGSTPSKPQVEANAAQETMTALPQDATAKAMLWFNCASRKDGDLPAHLTAVQNVVGSSLPLWGHWAGAEAGKESNSADITTHTGAGVFALIYEQGGGGDDPTAPTPDPLTWASVPASTGSSSISMTATTASDPSGVEYYFECTAGGGNDSGWQSGTTYEDTGLSPSTQYTYHVKARDLSTNQNETAWSTAQSATTSSASGTFQQDSGTDGIVSMEAENYDLNTAQGGHTWDAVTDPADYSGTGAMQALPNSGTNNNTGYSTSSPRLDFQVNFVKTGTHYVWVRTNANGSGNDDSLHSGINNTEISTADNMLASTSAGWTWTNATMDGPGATVNITSTGEHSVNIWMREDGCRVDKVVLTTNSGYTPTGYGPAESPRGGGDTDPPTPDPLTWATVPYSTGTTSISMTATTATDSSGVEYYFECTAGGGNDSGWQSGTAYEDTGLSPSTQYTYRVQARDKSANQNTGGWSTSESATTDTPPDTDPPTPDPLTWASVPASTGTTSISMTATTASDSSGVEYYFECTAGGGNDSGWRDSTTYEDTGLSSSTQYTYRVQARDKSANQNAGGWSTSESATTDSAGGDVQIIGSWTSGTTHADPAGTDRALIFIAYAESMTDTSDLGSVTYGGQAMTKVVEKNMHDGWSAYTCAFILNEAGIASATSDDFVVTWNTSPSGTPAYSSVFLSGVDQSSMVGQTGTGGSTTTTAETSPLSNSDGDMAIVAGTCNTDADYSTINGFIEAIEVVPQSADGIGGYLSCTGSDVTPGVSHPSVNRQSVIGFIVQAGAGAPPDTTPPTPDPLTWSTVPYSTGTTSISMTATTASDQSGVEYYFDCTAGGGNDSGWQDSTTYEDTGLSPSTQYTYRVQARDKSTNQNAGGWSTSESATTDTPPDTDPPTPDPLTWASVPASTGSSSISMTATTASDPSGVEYYFECTAGGGNNSGWQDSTSYEDTGLSPSTQYTYRVQARDKSANQNAGGWSTSESATTGVSDANLLGHWTFDDGSGTSVADSSGNGNTGTLSGTPQWITGQIGGAIDLDGVDDYMDGFSVDIGDVWSITAWAKPLASPEFQGFLGSSSGNYIQLQSIRFHYKGTNNNYTSFTEDLDWHHFAITRDASGAILVYIDGTQADSYTDTDATFTVSQVGRFWDNSNYTYEGGVDDLRLYDKVLSQAEVQTIMSGGGGEDTDPPTPDPLTWSTVPYSTGTTSISMMATTASDGSGVEYYFECTAGGGNDSGWQDSTIYEDTGLSPSTQYTYHVQARDKSANQNAGGWSTSESATTDTPADTTPPTPDPLTWATVPYATGTTSISMTATTASDPSGVEYYFECTAGGGNDSGWQDSTTYEDTGLSPSTQYTYRVQARDKSANQNAGDWSTSESATTDSAGGDVEIIGSWTSGTTHADPTGTGRALIFIAYAESMTDTSDLGSVTYGGQAMTKLVEKNMHDGWSAYTCAFILNESGIASATSDDFVVTWNTSPSGTPAYSSVFLSGVDQSSMVGQTGTGGSTTTTAETSPLSNSDGDMAIVAGTCNTDADYSTINGFIEAIEVVPQSADGIGGYLSCTGSDVTPGVSHPSVSRQSVIGFILQAGAGAPPDTTPPTPDPLTWATVPYSTGTTSISMTATTATDSSGVEYYFECTAGGGNDSGWQSGANYEDTGLSPSTQYTYRSKARDLSANQNETGWSSALSATTDSSSTNMTITSITTNAADYPNSEIPKYRKFEITFDVNDTVATNLQMPYDPSPPNGVSSNGITVNMLCTPDNWTTTYTQPAFYYQEFDHQVKSSKDWIYPTDNYCWKARFAPNQTGTWKFKLSAQDSSGTVQSSEQVFTVVSSSRKGFIKVSPNDARYFEYENGDIFLGLGHNIRYGELNWDDPVVENEPMFQDFNSKGMQLFRTWLSHWGIYSSCWDNWQSPLAIYHGMDPPSQQLEMAYSYQDHDVSMKVGYNDTNPGDEWPAGAGMFLGFGKRGPAVKRNTDYHIWVRYYIPNTIPGPRIAGNPYGLVLKTGGWLGSYNDPSTFADPGTGTPISSYVYSATGDWTMLETDLTTGGSSDFLDYLYIVLENVQTSSNSFAYIDEVIIREDLGGGQYGPNILTDSMMNSHQYMDQKKSFAFDKTLELAEQYDIYFKLVLLEKNEWTMNRIDYDGNLVPGSPSNNNFYGDWGNVTKVRWLQQAWWRYCQARWGYSQNIHTWELLNEGDPWNGRHYTLTEKFAQYMHQYSHNMHLSSTSTWGSFPRDEFWDNASYPSVDYADYHKYPPTFNDIAAEVESYSMQYGALRPGGAGKPLILGETGYSSAVNNDANGIWFHNFTWAQVNSGGMYQQYWCEHQEFSQTNDPRDHFVPYKNFIEDVPLNNGNYVDLAPTVSDPNMRTWGQKDTTNEKAHLWIQNDRHTWYNIVNENPISSVSGTVEITGFSPSQGYTLQWWDPYEPNKAQQIISTEPVTADSGGKITITVSSLTGDIAAKIE